jgi:hypothetical protein
MPCRTRPSKRSPRSRGLDSTHLHVSRLMMFETRWSASQTRYAANQRRRGVRRVEVTRSRISGSTSATSAAVRRPVRRITVRNWSSAARQPRHPSRCFSIRLRWSPLTSPSRYVVTMSTSSMHLSWSGGESLSVVIAYCSPRGSAPSVGGRGREPAGVRLAPHRGEDRALVAPHSASLLRRREGRSPVEGRMATQRWPRALVPVRRRR